MWNRFSDLWCRAMHRKAMWPIHGRYICPECLREHRVDWAAQPHEYVDPALHTAELPVNSTVTLYQ